MLEQLFFLDILEWTIALLKQGHYTSICWLYLLPKYFLLSIVVGSVSSNPNDSSCIHFKIIGVEISFWPLSRSVTPSYPIPWDHVKDAAVKQNWQSLNLN